MGNENKQKTIEGGQTAQLSLLAEKPEEVKDGKITKGKTRQAKVKSKQVRAGAHSTRNRNRAVSRKRAPYRHRPGRSSSHLSRPPLRLISTTCTRPSSVWARVFISKGQGNGDLCPGVRGVKNKVIQSGGDYPPIGVGTREALDKWRLCERVYTMPCLWTSRFEG